MTRRLSPPSDLGDRGLRLWQAYEPAVRGSMHDDPDGRHELLVEAARTVDLLERMDEALRDSLVVPGSQGQDRPHPLLTQRRAALADLVRLLEALR